MEADDIVTLIASTRSVMDMVLGAEVSPGRPFGGDADPDFVGDISVVVGFEGDLEGTIALVFPLETAEGIAARLAGRPLPVEGGEFAEAMGTLLRTMVDAGRDRWSRRCEITGPWMVLGHGHLVRAARDRAWICVPFDGETGRFRLEIDVASERSDRAAQAA